MKVLIADNLPSDSLNPLREAGHQISMASLDGEALTQALADFVADVLVVRSTKVSRAALQASPPLGLVVRAGAGYDNIDVGAASELGIFVANCPGKNANAVAELAIGLMIALDRHIPDGVQASREGRWNKARFAKARGLCQRTLGVIGLGTIGTLVSKAALGLGMQVVAWSRSLTPERAAALGVTQALSAEEVAGAADVVSVHLAANAHTRHLAGRAFFESMKPGALFVNTSRSSVVDEEALAWAISTKGIRAGLDVCDGEPRYKKGAFDWPMADNDSVYVTHHIGASTTQAQEATVGEAVRVILAFAEEGVVPNCVNMKRQSAATHLLTVRHKDRIGVLASVLDIVRSDNLNVQEMENLVFAGPTGAACAKIRVSGNPSDTLVTRIEGRVNVFAASLITL